jgi:hypothetical protein
MSSPCSLTSTGVVNPNAVMLSAICRIYLTECVLACGLGLIRLIDNSRTVVLFSSMPNSGDLRASICGLT